MLGVEFDTAEHAEEVQWACFERGLLVLECGTLERPDVAAADGHRGRDGDRRCASSARPSRGSPATSPRCRAEAGALHEVEAAG